MQPEKSSYFNFPEEPIPFSNHISQIPESPLRYPPLSPEYSKTLTRDNSKILNNTEDQNLALSQKNIDKLLKKFNKSQPSEKFNSFVSWVEEQNIFTPKIYANIKDFKFFPSSNNGASFLQASEVSCLAISPDNTLLAMGFDGKGISILDIKNIDIKKQNLQESLFISAPEEEGLISNFNVSKIVIDFDNNLYSSGDNETKIKQWSMKNGKCLMELDDGHLSPVICLSTARDLLASGDNNGQIIIWDLQRRFDPKKIEGAHKGPVTAIILSQENDLLYSGSQDKTIKVWNTKFSTLEFSLEGHNDTINGLALAKDLLASGGNDNLVKVWDLNTKKEKMRFDGHNDNVTSLDFSPDGGLLVSSSLDRSIKVWNVKKHELKKTLEGHTDQIKCLVVSTDGRKIISSASNDVRVWNFDKDYEKHLLQGHKEQVTSIVVFPDNIKAVSSSSDKKMMVWDLAKVKNILIPECEEHSGMVKIMAVNYDGSKFVSGDTTGRIIVWEIKTFAKSDVQQLFQSEIIMIRFLNEDNSRFLASCIDGNIKIFDTIARSVEKSFNPWMGDLTATEITTNNEYLAIGSRCRFNVFRFGVEKLEKINDVIVLNFVIIAIRATYNSRHLVLGLENGILQVFSLSSFKFIREIIGPQSKILTLEICKDNTTIITSFEDHYNSIRLFDLENGEQIGLEENQVHPVNCMALTPDDAKLISIGGSSNSLKLMVLNKIKTKRIFKRHKKEIRTLDITEDQTLLAAGSNDATISLWNLKTFEFKNNLEGHMQKVLAIKFMKKEKKLVSGSADHSLRIWDIETNTCLATLKKVGGWISDLVLTGEGDRAIVSCHDGLVSIFDLKNKEKGKEIVGQYKHDHCVECVALDTNDEYIFSGDKLGLLKIYDIVRKSEVHKFNAHKGSCNSMIVNYIAKSKGYKVVTCGADKEIKIWSINSILEETLIEALKGHTNEVLSIAINQEGTRLFSGSNDKSILMWDLTNLKQIAELDGHHSAINTLALSKNGMNLISGSDDKTIRVWNLRDSKQLPFLDGHSQPISRLVLTPDNKTLISGGQDKLVIIWDLKTNKQLRTIHENDGKITGLAVSSDGIRVVVGTDGRLTKIFELETGEKVEEFKYELATCFDLILSRDNYRVFIGYSDSVIRIWDRRTKSISASFDGHHGFVLCLLVNSLENRLVSGSDDNNAIIWDIRTSEKLIILEGHEKEISAICLSHDEKRLYTGGGDKKVIIWDFNTGILLKELNDHNNPITSFGLSPDHKFLVVGCAPLIPTAEKRKNIYIYNINDEYRLLKKPAENCKGCTALLFSHINGQLFTADRDKSIVFYDLSKLLQIPDNSPPNLRSQSNFSEAMLHDELPGCFKGYSLTITAEVIAEDNSYIALADDDFIITVWDLTSSKRIASFGDHTGMIRAMISTKKRRIISGSNDKSIFIWDIDRLDYQQGKKRLSGHSGAVLALVINQEEDLLISSSEDQTIRMWDLLEMKQTRKYDTKPDVVNALYKMNGDNRTFLAGGRGKILKLWTIDADGELIKPENLMFLNSSVEMITMSPNEKILVMFLSSKKMQVWDCKSLTKTEDEKSLATLMCEFDCPQIRSKPVFLSKEENRLMLYYNNLIDCFTGAVIFSFQTTKEILSFFFDFQSHCYLYISKEFELYKININWLATYLYKYLNYDSLTVLSKDADVICDRKISSLPYFFSFLHLISIFDKSELFTKEKLREIYTDEPDSIFSKFSSLDLFQNTPLDILIQRKNPTLIVKYFKLFFVFLKEKSTNFYQKSRFLNYNFRKDYTLGNLVCDLSALLGDDLSILNNLFNYAMMPLDPSIYDNSLVFRELNETVLIETDSLYTNDKTFIEKQLIEHLKNKEHIDLENDNENKSMVKARIICLPDLNQIDIDKTNDFYGVIGNLQANNEIFSNKTLEILVDFIWRTQISFYYKIELLVFLVIFSLFNINFLFLYQMRANIYNYENQNYNIACNVIDVLIMVNSLYTLINELRQLMQGIIQYFKYIWNYFDIALIPLAMSASILDMLLIHVESFRVNVPLVKVVYSISMFCLWFRFLSFFRALKETSFMIRLIFNVLIGVKNFVLFMVIFIFNMACSFYLLHTDNAGEMPSLWDTILIFYYTITGDTSGITDYDLIISEFADFYMIASSFLFAIMLMNLLVSIISDFHADIKDSELKYRLYEKMNILCDTNSSLTTNIAKKFFPPKQIGTFLIELYNEKHEREERDQLGALQKNIELDVERMLEVTNEKIEELSKELNGFEKETTHLFEELTEEVRAKMSNFEEDKEKWVRELKEEGKRNFEDIMREMKEIKKILGK